MLNKFAAAVALATTSLSGVMPMTTSSAFAQEAQRTESAGGVTIAYGNGPVSVYPKGKPELGITLNAIRHPNPDNPKSPIIEASASMNGYTYEPGSTGYENAIAQAKQWQTAYVQGRVNDKKNRALVGSVGRNVLGGVIGAVTHDNLWGVLAQGGYQVANQRFTVTQQAALFADDEALQALAGRISLADVMGQGVERKANADAALARGREKRSQAECRAAWEADKGGNRRARQIFPQCF